MATFGFAAGVYTKLGPGLYGVDVRRNFADARFSVGADKLTFEVIFCLLTTLGSITADPEFGTLLSTLVGRVAVNDEAALQSFIQTEFDRAQATIIARQAGQSLPEDQRLSRLLADEIVVERSETRLTITAVIVNAAGQSIGANIPIEAEAA